MRCCFREAYPGCYALSEAVMRQGQVAQRPLEAYPSDDNTAANVKGARRAKKVYLGFNDLDDLHVVWLLRFDILRGVTR